MPDTLPLVSTESRRTRFVSKSRPKKRPTSINEPSKGWDGTLLRTRTFFDQEWRYVCGESYKASLPSPFVPGGPIEGSLKVARWCTGQTRAFEGYRCPQWARGLRFLPVVGCPQQSPIENSDSMRRVRGEVHSDLAQG